VSGRVIADVRAGLPQLSALNAPKWCGAVRKPLAGQIIFASTIRKTEEFYD
jgi:hypothetical protein